MEEHLDGIFNAIIEIHADFLPIGFGIAVLGAIWQLGKAFAPQLYDPESGGIDLETIMKIFGIFLLLTFYNGFMGMVHTIPNLIANGTAGVVEEKRATFEGSLFATLSSDHLEINETAESSPDDPQMNNSSTMGQTFSSENSEEESAWSSFTSIFTGLGSILQDAFIGIIFYLFRIISLCVYSAILVLRTLFLSVLYIFGPMIIGLELIPGFSGSITYWVKRYISVHLWLPIAYVIEMIALGLMEILKYEDSLVVVSEDGTVFSPAITTFIFLAIVTVSYLAVPSIANMLIGGSSSSSSASKVKKAASAAMSGGKSLLIPK